MNLHKLILSNNACFKAGKTITPKGIMVHSTGANNPNLKRYVGPDDGLLGKNQYGNHWNTATPGGRQICVHAFIGKLADGSIATYQTLPWNPVTYRSTALPVTSWTPETATSRYTWGAKPPPSFSRKPSTPC